MVAHTFISILLPWIGRWKQMDLCEFNANLVYRVCSGSLRGVQIAQTKSAFEWRHLFLSFTHPLHFAQPRERLWAKSKSQSLQKNCSKSQGSSNTVISVSAWECGSSFRGSARLRQRGSERAKVPLSKCSELAGKSGQGAPGSA